MIESCVYNSMAERESNGSRWLRLLHHEKPPFWTLLGPSWDRTHPCVRELHATKDDSPEQTGMRNQARDTQAHLYRNVPVQILWKLMQERGKAGIAFQPANTVST